MNEYDIQFKLLMTLLENDIIDETHGIIDRENVNVLEDIANELIGEYNSLVNGAESEKQTALHKQNVVFSETVCKYKDSCGHYICNLTECDEFEENVSEAEVCSCSIYHGAPDHKICSLCKKPLYPKEQT